MKFRTSWVCSNCGYKTISYLGKCPECAEWNTMVEEVEQEVKNLKLKVKGYGMNDKKPMRIEDVKQENVVRISTGFSEVDRVLGGGMVLGSVILIAGEPGVGKSTLLLQIAKKLSRGFQNHQNPKIEDSKILKTKKQRNETGKNFDTRSAIIKNMVVGNDKINQENGGNVVLYVSGEESESQIAIRFARIENSEKDENLKSSKQKSQDSRLRGNDKGDGRDDERYGRDGRGDAGNGQDWREGWGRKAIGDERDRGGERGGLLVLNETNADLICKLLEEIKPDLAIVDSVQTIYSEDLTGTAGTVGQVRECTFRLSQVCKSLGIPLFLVGQITKEGAIAGPKVLEHLVDVTLYFEGEHFQNLRILRGVKNRFGAVDEAGIFEMEDVGLVEVKNPSELFLTNKGSLGNRGKLSEQKNKIGAVVTCTLEGTRPLLAEIQALTVFSSLPAPRRVFSGLDFNRCQVVLAVLQKYLNIDFSHLDVYVSVSGGLKIKEPAADLAIALSLVSSVKNVSFDVVCFGEIGLLGDVRRVNSGALRRKECERLGYKNILSADEVSNIRDAVKKL